MYTAAGEGDCAKVFPKGTNGVTGTGEFAGHCYARYGNGGASGRPRTWANAKPMRFCMPSRGASGPERMNFTSIEEKHMPNLTCLPLTATTRQS